MNISIIYYSKSGNTKTMGEVISEGCKTHNDVNVKLMAVDTVDDKFVQASDIVLFGSPTYCGNCCWQIKQYLDYHPKSLIGKLGGVFVSQNQPGGGGASFAAMSMIAELLVCGMLVYSSGITEGAPIIHFGAVSQNKPLPNTLDYERCWKFGERLTQKAFEIFTNKLKQTDGNKHL
jgi:NAD(P)H dehydrogenase (quinone)